MSKELVIGGIAISCSPKRVTPTIIIDNMITNDGGYDSSTFMIDINPSSGLGTLMTSGVRLGAGARYSIVFGSVQVNAEL